MVEIVSNPDRSNAKVIVLLLEHPAPKVTSFLAWWVYKCICVDSEGCLPVILPTPRLPATIITYFMRCKYKLLRLIQIVLSLFVPNKSGPQISLISGGYKIIPMPVLVSGILAISLWELLPVQRPENQECSSALSVMMWVLVWGQKKTSV